MGTLHKTNKLKNDRISERALMNCGVYAEIIEYISSSRIKVKFDGYDNLIETTYGSFNKKSVRNKFIPSVCGVGYVGDDTLKTYVNGKTLRSYTVWLSMIGRCYGNTNYSKRKSYIGCTVCEEWHSFANFKKWYDYNYYTVDGDRVELDKDILVKGNKIYSPTTCIFVPHSINSLFIRNSKIRGTLPIGVRKKKNKFIARCNNGNNVTIELGTYNTPNDAFTAYKKYKENLIKTTATKYKNSIPEELYYFMINYEVDIDD